MRRRSANQLQGQRHEPLSRGCEHCGRQFLEVFDPRSIASIKINPHGSLSLENVIGAQGCPEGDLNPHAPKGTSTSS